VILAEEVARAGSGGLHASLFSHGIGAPPIARVGSDALKARVLPGILAGEKISALAITEVTVCGFRQADLHAMVDSHVDIARQITNIQAHYLSTCESNVLGLGRKTAEQRIAHTVADLYHRLDRRAEVDSDALSMPFPLTQEMLGELTGLTPVHTNRVLRKLRNDGVMISERQRVKILDLPRLLELGEYRVNLVG
jgi:CRP-like cAMP-binding protein